MSDVQEALSNATGLLTPPLLAGLQQISDNEEVEFTTYQKFTLPLDGSVFWVKGGSFCISGSLHYSTGRHQDESDTKGVDRVVFTTTHHVANFNEIAPTTLIVGDLNGFRFSFSSHGLLYENAGLFHYVGDSVWPVLESQLIDSIGDINADTLVVSNSLPIWLTMQSYAPIWLDPPNPNVTLYPSYLVPDNLRPPYGTVHVEPGSTQAFESVPHLDQMSTHTQLAADRVRVTLYGMTNNQACDWLDLALQYIRDNGDAIGLMNMPIVRDEKQPQVEIATIAMKKVIDFEVSYLQTRTNDIARQLFLEAVESFLVGPMTPP